MGKKEIITSDDILGKEAIDPDGSILGVVTKVHIDNSDRKVIGITIDMGFAKPDLYVGINNVRNFGEDAVLLKTVPAPKFKGINVLTAEGKKLGKVMDIVMKNSHVEEFIISNFRFIGKKFPIKYSDIKEIGESIILKEGYKHREKSKKTEE
ncbi:MAG TPA: PRC-barrel domain-containing protein [Candidatus Nanoarchaeia archaeon]|nr:PRC-barrel domain-containing protein [Candidatus Nanoarchaeia archaeon]